MLEPARLVCVATRIHCSGSHTRHAHRAPHISTHGILTDPFSPIVVLALRHGVAAPAAKNTASSVL